MRRFYSACPQYLLWPQCLQCLQYLQCLRCFKCLQCLQCPQCLQCIQCLKCLKCLQTAVSTVYPDTISYRRIILQYSISSVCSIQCLQCLYIVSSVYGVCRLQWWHYHDSDCGFKEHRGVCSWVILPTSTYDVYSYVHSSSGLIMIEHHWMKSSCCSYIVACSNIVMWLDFGKPTKLSH